MNSSNEVRLNLEVLEDRLALSGAFGGAIGAGIPVFPSSPYTLMAESQAAGTGQSPVGFNAHQVNPLATFQNQLQAIQAAQTAMIDQVFGQWQSILQQMHINTYLII